MTVTAIIPARIQSTRLPRKLLLEETGKPLIQYVWEAACGATLVDNVLIATDSEEIAKTVVGFGGNVKMTEDHPSGTDRVAEAATEIDAEIIINLQGDEPELQPEQVDHLVRLMSDHPEAEMATLATPISTSSDRDDPSCVKVVTAEDGRALYFSRSTIPFCRDDDPDELLWSENPWQLHLGLYAYRKPFLLKFAASPQSRLEKLEKLEQLRALELGASIHVGLIEHPAVGIDTPDDYARFVQRQKGIAA